MAPARPMLNMQDAPYCVRLRESCGLYFEPQILEIAVPDEASAVFALRDARSGRLFPVQKSRQNPARGFLLIEIAPFEALELALAESADDVLAGVAGKTVVVRETRLGNGSLELELPSDGEEADGLDVAGPIARLRLMGGEWRGRSFFDTRSRVAKRQMEWLETGPLRSAYRYHVAFADGGSYQATVTLDAAQEFAVVEEALNAAPGDQIVWDFGGQDLPRELFLLDPTAGGAHRPLHYHHDNRQARLTAWTQYQQLFDLSDGFALLYRREIVGFVALEGGDWSGNRLNHLEAWTRRWWRDDPRTRREPSGAKSDSMPGLDPVPARGVPQATPHFCIEGWIGGAVGPEDVVPRRRRFALVVAPRQRLFPGADTVTNDTVTNDEVPSGHFEVTCDRDRTRRDRTRREQSLLRKIHIQRGLLPLQTLAKQCFVWPNEADDAAPPEQFGYPHPLLDHALRHQSSEEAERIAQMRDYLAARVYGFWEGGGASHSNCVVGRVIAPEMFHFETLARQGRLGAAEATLCRAHFAFLCHLFGSDNYYPGAATMQPNGHPDSFEPTLAGMANQNFFTDVIMVGAAGAQVFHHHPQAALWRHRWALMWQRQLEFHVYPQSGVWEESHTYYQHVLATVMPVLLRRQDDGLDDAHSGGFADPLFQKMAGALLSQLTPRVAPDNRRHQVAFGDHGVGHNGPFLVVSGELARALAPHNLAMARQFAWTSREMGGSEVPGLEGEPVEWQTGHIAGLGFCFRAANAGGETLLALRAGAAWGHHHIDDGSLQFFAFGRSLVGDVAFGHIPQDGQRKFEASGHSRWSLRDGTPLNHLWRFNRGDVVAWGSEKGDQDRGNGGRFPFAVAFCPVLMLSHRLRPNEALPMMPPVAAWRTVVQLAPTAFLIVDESDAAFPQVVRFHVPGENLEIRANGARAVYDDVALHIVPVPLAAGETERDVTAHVAGTDRPRDGDERPRDGDERFVTSELRFDLSGRRAAFLVAAQSAQAALEVSDQTLSGDGWRVRVGLAPDGTLRLADLESGATLEVAPRTVPASFAKA